MKVAVVYWSSTGNTEAMAQAVVEGAKRAGAEAELFTAAVLIKKACGIETASGTPNKTKVATITKAQIEEIAKTKMPDLNAGSLETAMSMIAGTARSMGVTVAD